MRKIAIHTALCVLCLGLERSGMLTLGELRRVFFDVDLTMAELDAAITSYGDLEKRLLAHGVQLEKENADMHHARLLIPSEFAAASAKKATAETPAAEAPPHKARE